MRLRSVKYTNSPEILTSAHYITRTCTVTQAMGKDIDGKKIVQAGTPFPANDATIKGLIFRDVDVTYGDAEASLLVEGYVNEDRLPETIADTVKAKIPEIKFE